MREKTFENRLKELESRIGSFRNLTETINKSLQDIITASVETATVSTRQIAERANRIAPYKLIQESSNKLFSLLAHKWTCSRHRKHWVVITLLNRNAPNDNYDGPRFEIDVENDDRSSQSPQIWLEIQLNTTMPPESSHSTLPQVNTEVWDDLEMIQKHREPITSEKMGKARKRLTKPIPKSVRFQTTSAESPQNASAASASIEPEPIEVSSTTLMPQNTRRENLELLQDLCCYMEQTCSIDSRRCLGFIEDTGIHHFWRRGTESSHAQKMTLRDILVLESRGKGPNVLSQGNIARIGVSLAAAVLQYRSTPWLTDTWDSSQVLFLRSIREDAGEENFSPSFSAELKHPEHPNEPGIVTDNAHRATSSAAPMTLNAETVAKSRSTFSMARNASLFCLGVVLLEIGYGKSWSLLQEENLQEQRYASPLIQPTDYSVAERLATSKSLCRKMGYDYVKIVRKCLGCDFGLGENDLENDNLQDCFLDQVVFGLQRIERAASHYKV